MKYYLPYDLKATSPKVESGKAKFAHLIGVDTHHVSTTMSDLQKFWSLDSDKPVRVCCQSRDIVVSSPAILLMAVTTTNASEQIAILSSDLKTAKTIIDNSGSLHPSEYFAQLFGWVMCLVTAQYMDQISPLLDKLISTGVTDIAYITQSSTSPNGVSYSKSDHAFAGGNLFGVQLSAILNAYDYCPTELYEIRDTLAQTKTGLNLTLLGLPVLTFKRPLSVKDKDFSPKRSEVFQIKTSKSKLDSYLEL